MDGIVSPRAEVEAGSEISVAQSPETPDIPAPTSASGRPQRNHRLPKRFQDILPEPLVPALAATEEMLVLPSLQEDSPQRTAQIEWDHLQTPPNQFGLWRDYAHRPSFDPDGLLTLNELSNNPLELGLSSHELHGLDLSEANHPHTGSDLNDPSSTWPFANKSTQLLMAWLNNGKTSKSEAEADSLVQTCLLSPKFQVGDLTKFSAHRENQKLDRELAISRHQSSFTETPVTILVPSGSQSIPPHEYLVPGLLHRKITTLIQEAFHGSLAHRLHYSPFELYRQTTNSADNQPINERIYGEIYSSNAFLNEYKNVRQRSPLPPDDANCRREKVVAALMFSSDATRLANFGTGKAWPIYMMLGNLSKYVRSEMNSGALYHLAYIPFVSRLHTAL